MSVLFPNVPNTPGVPNVARAGAVLQSMLGGTGQSISYAQNALTSIANSDLVSATSQINSTISTASGALTQANTVFSTGNEVVGSLSGTVANANSALSALASGDIAGAADSLSLAVDTATRAYTAISNVISPPTPAALSTSGDQTNAETATQWGLFNQSGDVAIEADNLVMFENNLEARISDYPVEQGGFASFNKVIVPYDIRLVMTRGGTVEDRQTFLQAALDAWESTDLFNVVTPECVYLDLNVVGVHQQRAADRGLGLLSLEISLRKIRQTATLAYSKTKAASSSGLQQNGSVQTSQPAASQQYAGTAQ